MHRGGAKNNASSLNKGESQSVFGTKFADTNTVGHPPVQDKTDGSIWETATSPQCNVFQVEHERKATTDTWELQGAKLDNARVVDS